MVHKLKKDGCLYQDDVVDYLIKAKYESLLRENQDGNPVLKRDVLVAFRKLTEPDVVWVRPHRYWRIRVEEDEPGREARG